MEKPQSSDAPMTYQQFLDFVADKDERYEYVDGHAVAMGIPSKTHQRISKYLTNKLDAHLENTPCEALPSVALRTGVQDRAPDIMVLCEKAVASDETADNTEAKLIIEILSPNRGDDLTLKHAEYQAMFSIEEYIIIDSTKRWVRHYYRNADGKFVYDRDFIGGRIRFASIGFTLDVDDLYRFARLQT